MELFEIVSISPCCEVLSQTENFKKIRLKIELQGVLKLFRMPSMTTKGVYTNFGQRSNGSKTEE